MRFPAYRDQRGNGMLATGVDVGLRIIAGVGYPKWWARPVRPAVPGMA